MSQASLTALRNLLASCETFQELVGAEDAEEATPFIAIYSSDPPMSAPCATIWDVDNTRAGLSPDAFFYSGTMGLQLELLRPEPDEEEDGTEYDIVKATWEALKVEMQDAANIPGGLSIAEIRDDDAEDSEDRQDLQRWFFTCEIDWPGGV